MLEILLDDLAVAMELYISDLQITNLAVIDKLRETQITDYSIKQWNYALTYMTNRPIRFTSYDEISQYLSKL